MSDITYTASVFSEATQQEVRVIAYEDKYASIEVPDMEVMLTREQIRKVGLACLRISDLMRAV